MTQAYGIGGFVSIPPSAISANGPPPASFKGELGQPWFDHSTVPPTQYIYNGSSWALGGNEYATTSAAGVVKLSANVTTDLASTTLVPYAKAVYDYGQSLVLAGANIAQTGVTGITNLATDVQAVAGTATVPGVTALAIQPSNLAAVFAANPAIGGTTPAAAVVTTLGFTTATGTLGGTWASGGTAISIGADADTSTINVGTGAAARTIHIGDSTQANLLTNNQMQTPRQLI